MQIPQHQSDRPGLESKMIGKPEYDDPNYKGSSKLVFLASEDSTYLAGQVLHPNGGDVVNG